MSTEPIDDVARLTDIFKQGPMREWPIEDIAKSKIIRFAQAYLMMTRDAAYTPTGPSELFGNSQLAQLYLEVEPAGHRERQYLKAADYALTFNREEANGSFWIGSSDYAANRAYVMCIEAARVLADSDDGDCAVKLLKLAIKEIEQEIEEMRGATHG